MDRDQILARIKWRQLQDDESEPTDAGVVSTSRLLQYITPVCGELIITRHLPVSFLHCVRIV